MRTIQTNVYTYDELSDAAKEKARDWFRRSDSEDTFWSESVTDDFADIAKACGFSLATARGRNAAKAIYWEGFSHQGSGASFEASWRASAVDIAAMLKNRPATFTDEKGNVRASECNAKLAALLERFAALAMIDLSAFGNVETSHRGHSLTTEYDTEREDDDASIVEGSDAIFRELCDDLAHWLYRALEQEYEYRCSDEIVAENILANEYEFTADGKPA